MKAEEKNKELDINVAITLEVDSDVVDRVRTGERDFFGWVKARMEKYPDESTMALLDKYFEERLDIPVFIAQDPLDSVAGGTKKMLEEQAQVLIPKYHINMLVLI